MNSIYDKGQFCMKFKNEEIIKYLAIPLEKYPDICIRMLSSESEEITSDTTKDIEWVCFDGDKENFYIRFIEHQTFIFVLNEEFMFIDDDIKENIRSSDTYHNVVFEGQLRDKTHKEILELFFKFITVLMGATKISIEEIVVSQETFQYPKCTYTVKLTNNSGIKNKIQFENILFSINE